MRINCDAFHVLQVAESEDCPTSGISTKQVIKRKVTISQDGVHPKVLMSGVQ